MLLDRIPLYQNNFGLGLKLMIFFWKVIKTVPNPTHAFGVKPSQTKQYLLYQRLLFLEVFGYTEHFHRFSLK